jgi:hypothetical protein
MFSATKVQRIMCSLLTGSLMHHDLTRAKPSQAKVLQGVDRSTCFEHVWRMQSLSSHPCAHICSGSHPMVERSVALNGNNETDANERPLEPSCKRIVSMVLLKEWTIL